MGCGEVEFEEGFGVENSTILPGLVEAVVASAAEFGEAVFEGVGEDEMVTGRRGFRGFFAAAFLLAWGLRLRFGRG